ncbi:MAG TPA: ABC transporter permease [Clostridiales bacterium]|nr:MAG: Sulfate transport system permease protein CysW [Firmicutes bacterium ADurb.Bin262]HQK74200.1 ABC transporter permease [Clostridiales bacterium]
MEQFKEAIRLVFSPDKELWQIIGVTLVMTFASTAISCALGIFPGIFIGSRRFRGKKLLMKILYTFMGLPPVVAGLVVFLLLSNRGPLGSLHLLFSVEAMVIAQCVLIVPIITGLTASAVALKYPVIAETSKGLRLSGWKQLLLLLSECRGALISVALTGFGRAISEVGAVNLVGGNIRFKTRVMTTSIMFETGMGNFELAIALGILLLTIAFAVNFIASTFRRETDDYA